MKNLLKLFLLISFICPFQFLNAQNSEKNTADYQERSPLYDYSERNLNNIDSIPDFESKKDKLMITGTIYQSDGITPAKDVILYISQPNEDGDYELKKLNDKRYVYHRGWVKTDADGKYTFYTFIPGNFIQYREFKHIHPTIKEPGKEEYALDAFLFDNDPFLSKSCRKRLAKKGMDSILVLEKNDSMYITTKDIVLVDSITAYNK